MTISNHTSVTEGEMAILFCEAAGFMSVGVTWTHDGEAITNSSHISITAAQEERLVHQSFLVITMVEPADAGIYTCSVSSSGPSIDVSTQLSVFCECDFVLIVYFFTLHFMQSC